MSSKQLIISAIAVVVLLLAQPLSAQQDFSKVEIKTIPVSGNVSMLMGAGGNIGVLVGEKGVILIDDQYAPLSQKILAAVAALSDKPVSTVVNTHWHGDHTGGNEALAEKGVIVVAHDNVRTRMSTRQFQAAFNRETLPSPSGALPVVTFSDTLTLHIGDETLHAFRVGPAHTDGDVIIHFASANAIHMGDTYFAGMFPFVDISSGGNLAGMIGAVNQALEKANDDTKIIPGHGPLSNTGELKAYRDMLVTVLDRVTALAGEGKSLEEIVAAKPLADLEAQWGGGFINAERLLGFAHAAVAE